MVILVDLNARSCIPCRMMEPILTLIIQQQLATGILLIALFGIGHCIPIIMAGSSTARVRKLLENNSMAQGSLWFKRAAGTLIARASTSLRCRS